MRISLLSSALVASLVGYGSTIALVLAAARTLGATEAETASWVLAICLAKAAGSAWLSFSSRVPVVLAWSTPGAALIAASQGATMAQGVGAFVITGLMVMATGAIGPLGRLVARIPEGIASGMLAGVLLPFCLKGAVAAQALGGPALAILIVFLLIRLGNPALAVLGALAIGVALAYGLGQAHLPELSLPLPHLTLIPPVFRVDVILGLALPLYLVTMASQNLPGFATLRAAGYAPPVRPALLTTGALSAIAGLFGAHTVSMAAITAAICLGDDVHPDRAQRWKVGLAYAAAWIGLGLLGPISLPLLHSLPPEVMALIVGLALIGPLTSALSSAYQAPETRFAATITAVTTASGVTATVVIPGAGTAATASFGAAFLGLIAGLAIHALGRMAKRP